MWKPSTIFVGVLLVLDSFFVAYAVGLNSRHVLVVDPTLAGKTSEVISTSNQAPASGTDSDTTVATVSTPGTPDTTHTAATQFTDFTAADSRLQSSLQSAAQSGILDPTQDQKFRPNDPV